MSPSRHRQSASHRWGIFGRDRRSGQCQSGVLARKTRLCPLTPDQKESTLMSLSEGSMSKPTDLVQGTVDLLILKTIALGPMHGWAIARRIRQVSKDVLQVNQGALYPALHRLEQQGWISAEWGESENNRQAKFYSLTKSGKKYLQSEQANWERLSRAIGLVLKPA